MSTAIVGSAAYLVGMRLGKQIDSHDDVVRINSGYALAESAPEDYGRRTTICYVTQNVQRKTPPELFPKDAQIKVKKHVRLSWTVDYGKYEANTGIAALVEYAMDGRRLFVTGFDFYSAVTDNVIQPPCNDARYAIDPSEFHRVYGPGYQAALCTDISKGLARHRGGLRDFALLVRLIRLGCPITVDDHLQMIIDKNIERIPKEWQ